METPKWRPLMDTHSPTSRSSGQDDQDERRKQSMARELAIHVPNPIPDNGRKPTISAPR